jgi:hypothetical protein
MNEPKRLSRTQLLVVILILPAFAVFWNTLFKIGTFTPIELATHGLIQRTLIANVVQMLLLGAFLFQICGLNLESILINKTKAKRAVVTGLLAWVVTLTFLRSFERSVMHRSL